MYRLIKGRESSSQSVESAPPTPASSAKPPVAGPVSAWSSSIPTRRPLLERVGPRALVLGLIGLLAISAAYSLRPDPNPEILVDPPMTPVAAGPAPPVVAPIPVAVATKPAPEPEPKAEEPKPAEVAGVSEPATIESIRGVVLKPSADGGSWDRVAAKEPLKTNARLLNLAPFRNVVKLGKAEVELVDTTDLVLVDEEKDATPRVDLRRGRLILRASDSAAPLAVRFEGHVLTINPPVGVALGLERAPSLKPGHSEPDPPRLRIFLPQGQASLKVGDAEEKLDGPGQVSLLADGKLAEKLAQAAPEWVVEAAPSSFIKEVGDQFLVLLRPGRPILSDLVEAMDDPQKDVKRLAVQALGAIGAIELVVTVLDRKEDPATHRAVVDILRSGLAQGGHSAKVVREALARQFDQPWAGITEGLLIGPAPEDAKDEAKLAKLVEYLSAPSRGTRELALENLRSLTRRDNLEYDPDHPEGKGLKAWQDLLRKKDPAKEARPAGARG